MVNVHVYRIIILEIIVVKYAAKQYIIVKSVRLYRITILYVYNVVKDLYTMRYQEHVNVHKITKL